MAVDPIQLKKFMAVYAEALKEASEDYKDEGYNYDEEELPLIIKRMEAALVRGSYNYHGRAFQITCKALKLRHTRKAINAYISSAPTARL